MSHQFLSDNKLITQLVENRAVAQEQVEKYVLMDYSSLLRLLWEKDEINQEAIARAIAITLHLPYLPGDEIHIDEEVHALLERFDAETNPILPLCKVDDALKIAVSDPFDLELKDRLEDISGSSVELVIASPRAIRQALHKSSGMVNRLESIGRETIDNYAFDSASISGDHLIIDENSAPVVKLVNTLLREAVAKKASDIHIENQFEKTVFRYRIDGVLRSAMEPLDWRYQEALISRIKIMSELDITERHVPQDGRFRLAVDHCQIDFRVSILPGIDCEDAVIRVLDSRTIPEGSDGFNLVNLGMTEEDVAVFREILSKPSGMVIVAGPTGSGKTTTLYAALNELDQTEGKTITIEDPIEYRLPGILQVPVNEKKKLTFSRGLRSILRHDPDRIMIGEIRDRETAAIAVQSSLTGHLLFTTIHANTPVDVINRFTHMGIPPEEILPSLTCIMSQRLVRKLCTICKVTSPENGSEYFSDEDISIYSSVGCEACAGTGYAGRTVVTEILTITPTIARLLTSGANHCEVTEAARTEGIISLRDSAFNKVKEGVTSISEVHRVLGDL